MARLDYPWLQTHRFNHQWFLRFLREYKEGVARGAIPIDATVRRELPHLVQFYMTCRDSGFDSWLSATHGGFGWPGVAASCQTRVGHA